HSSSRGQRQMCLRYRRIGTWTADKTKFEVTSILGPAGVPVGPVLSTKEVMTDESLYDGNTLVRINQGGKVGEYVTVGCPFTMSNYQPAYGPAPELGADTADVLTQLGYTAAQQASFAANGTTAPLKK
ncbi:MAG: CoA transferase, partial [Muribaculaceae bacterium]|nr:CoA transferase [Muribaculaceae bacterium]